MTRATTRHGLDAAECAALARVLRSLSELIAARERAMLGGRGEAAATWPGRAATVLTAEADRLRAIDQQQEGAPCG
jgi:hypothetical protein